MPQLDPLSFYSQAATVFTICILFFLYTTLILLPLLYKVQKARLYLFNQFNILNNRFSEVLYTLLNYKQCAVKFYSTAVKGFVNSSVNCVHDVNWLEADNFIGVVIDTQILLEVGYDITLFVNYLQNTIFEEEDEF